MAGEGRQIAELNPINFCEGLKKATMKSFIIPLELVYESTYLSDFERVRVAFCPRISKGQRECARVCCVARGIERRGQSNTGGEAQRGPVGERVS